MKVYIAGSSQERSVVAKCIARLRAAGVEITLDWPAVIESHGGMANIGLTETQRLRAADDDIRAVMACDIFWLICPTTKTSGCWFEFGVAVMSGKLCVTSGMEQMSIFTSKAFEYFSNEEEALTRLIEWHKNGEFKNA